MGPVKQEAALRSVPGTEVPPQLKEAMLSCLEREALEQRAWNKEENGACPALGFGDA